MYSASKSSIRHYAKRALTPWSLNVKLGSRLNQEKALVGAFSVNTNLRMELFQALVLGHHSGEILHVPDKNVGSL